MFTIRRPKLLFAGLPLLAVLFAANHVEYYHRQQQLPQDQVTVRVESGPIGHTTLGIEENGGPASRLQFATLGQWAFDPKAPSPCPESVQALNAKDSSCVGFMYPLEAGEKVKAFCLLRSTQTCCYGPRPQYNQYLFVEMPEPVKFERLTPVTVSGKFFVDPKPMDGYIYRMEGTDVKAAQDDLPDIDAAQAAQQAKLPFFDLALMDALEKSKQPTPELLALDGKQVVCEATVLDRTLDNPPQLVVGSPARFAAVLRPRLTYFNALTLVPRDARQIPPAWKLKVTFTGTLHVNRNEKEWKTTGIVKLDDAVLGVPGVSTPNLALDGGPLLPVSLEVLMVAALLVLTLWTKTPVPRPTSVPRPSGSGPLADARGSEMARAKEKAAQP